MQGNLYLYEAGTLCRLFYVYEPGGSACMRLLLRRTLVLHMVKQQCEGWWMVNDQW